MSPTAQLLRRLMAFQPVTAAAAQVNAALDFLQEHLDKAGLFTRVETCGDRHALYAAACADPVVDVLLNAHLDVVPAAAPEDYALREADGWYYGRGVVDDLGNCAVIATALAQVAGRASAGVIFSTDEEAGGETTRAMAARGYRARRLVLVFDVADHYVAATAQKGVLLLRLRAPGHACHAAEPWRGCNAIDRLVDGYVAVRRLFPPVTPPDEWHDTMAAVKVQAGTVDNRVPDTAELVLNVRVTETTDVPELLRELEAVSGLEIACDFRCPPVAVAASDPVVRRFLSAFEAGLEHCIRVKKMNGATDARHFVDMGVPIAMFGVPGADPHSSTERMEKAGFERFPAVLADYLLTTAPLPGPDRGAAP